MPILTGALNWENNNNCCIQQQSNWFTSMSMVHGFIYS